MGNFAHVMGSETVEHSTLPQSGDASQKLLSPCAKRAQHFYARHFYVSGPKIANVPTGVTLELSLSLSV